MGAYLLLGRAVENVVSEAFFGEGITVDAFLDRVCGLVGGKESKHDGRLKNDFKEVTAKIDAVP
jgi:hypothetical protein